MAGVGPDENSLYVADIGISNLAWKGMGKGRNKGINFDGEWVIKVEYQPAVE
jgi:hypothetical protein